MQTQKIIKSAIVGSAPESIFGPLPAVTVTYTDGSEEELFNFYPDEISFEESELIGKTRGDAVRLKQDKDKKFLQS